VGSHDAVGRKGMSDTRIHDLGGIIMRNFCGINNVNFAGLMRRR
jgi:hypothetical protein